MGVRYKVYLGMGSEPKKAGHEDVRNPDRDNRLSSRVQISTRLPLAHNNAAVPIQTLAALRLLDLPCFVPWYLYFAVMRVLRT